MARSCSKHASERSTLERGCTAHAPHALHAQPTLTCAGMSLHSKSVPGAGRGSRNSEQRTSERRELHTAGCSSVQGAAHVSSKASHHSGRRTAWQTHSGPSSLCRYWCLLPSGTRRSKLSAKSRGTSEGRVVMGTTSWHHPQANYG